ncbi:orotidine-5'-phosphate decarboxylase [uncultured Acetobacteroides sp.]|uniref:orotidine-5'-phosphate decarboxylase n=1 Tax=uncultured Acetobacteroides sp. TaxID=1760811 RepID=UPI0029F49F87|nr:orotidine-5'-phosphate decarboxylase [uncultured Acetobacteroides sp.]
MNAQQLFEQIQAKRSFLCVGLDSDITKIPQHLLSAEDPIFEFNKAIVDATAEYAVSYKPNLAFYESLGVVGWISLQKTVRYIRERYPAQFIIADAKRGDIGNTSEMYAKAFFEGFDFDAVTLAPYMGSDTVTPFLKYEGRWSIILALTSNKSAADFQLLEDAANGKKIYEDVITTSAQWGTADNTMYVVGATKAEMLGDVRQLIPNHFLLVPGVGAQGGSLSEVAKHGMNSQCGLLVNSSRAIIYADTTENFAAAAAKAAREVRDEMDILLKEKGL